MRTVVFDTNVLLADPNALFAFPDADVVIPETVLAELDKLKTSRVDPELRFRGREVSRLLFELSEDGNLVDGVALPDGGRLRVVPLDGDVELHEGLSARSADDRILAVALHLSGPDRENAVLVTNDLNMLLKAQTFGVKVERHADGADKSFSKRFIVRPFQRYKVPIGILAAALALFAAIVFLTIYGPGSQQVSTVPAELRSILTDQQEKALDAMLSLERNPSDVQPRLVLADFYFDLRDQTGNLQFGQSAARHYTAYLEVRPTDINARADYAATLFYLGQTDHAIQEVGRVLEVEPDHVRANFNLGIFYWRGRQDLPAAASQFRKVAELTEGGDAHAQLIHNDASAKLTQIEQEAKASGTPLPKGGTS
ncbi:MAG: hypothetical protein IBX62_03840 [Coriobacteriia bacterium]|nr:hypothetical protein [Coriobacteriia bacterium]